MGSAGDGERGADNGGAVISRELKEGGEGKELKPAVERSESGARGEIPPPPAEQRKCARRD